MNQSTTSTTSDQTFRRPVSLKPYKTDVAVLLIFFNRPSTFRRVFEEVKKARPSHLFLYQDGARGERDVAGVEACRAICADAEIDWQCEVSRLYQEKNFGCDPSEYLSQKWAFSKVDRCIVLEDDDVPSQSFFPFCKELLDRYADDSRVWMISGFNTDEVTPGVSADYFFTSVFSIWGWASWRRVVDTWDAGYSWLDSPEDVQRIERLIKDRGYFKGFIDECRRHRATGVPYYETVFWASMLLNNGLAAMPVKNQINNIGLTTDATHYQASFKTMPRRLRRMFTMKRFELDFPLHHPHFVMENTAYKESVYRAYALNHPWIKVGRSLEELAYNLRYGHFDVIGKAIANRVKKTVGLK